MNYRIRYRQPKEADEAEVIVEANSPTEALVKFRCTLGPRVGAEPQRDMVTSICPADRPDGLSW